jgi:hypothetical protein
MEFRGHGPAIVNLVAEISGIERRKIGGKQFEMMVG